MEERNISVKPLSKKYFQDYEMQETVGKDGKTERKMVYIGNTWSVCLPAEKYRKKKAVSAVLSVCCALFFLLANLQDTRSNIEGMLPAFGIIVVIPLFVLCYGCICGLWKKSVMTRADYVEYSMAIKFGGFFTTVLAALNFVWHGIFLVKSASPESRGMEGTVTVLWLVLFASSLFLWVAELRTEYVVRNRYGAVIHREHFRK